MTWDARKKHIEARRAAGKQHDDADLERLTAPEPKQDAPPAAEPPPPPPPPAPPKPTGKK